MLADLQVYDEDPIAQPASQRPGLRPRAVLQGGVSVFGKL
jgi:hypothetical protein